MSAQDPTRLAEQSATSPQLKGALEALGREGEGAERLARVAGKLAAVLDAPAPALPVSSRLLRLGLRPLTAGKLVGVLLAVGGSLWFALDSVPSGRPAGPSAQPTSAPLPRLAPPAAEPPAPAAPAVQQAPEEPSTPDEATPSAQLSRRPGPAVRTAKREVTSAAPVEGPQVGNPQASMPLADAAQGSVAGPPAPEAAASPAERPRPRSEAELLFEARKALAERPRTALALLEQHAQLYGHGQLAPEREVLAIEALRKLGDGKAADARARRFRAEYPDSFHRRGLDQGQP